MPPHGDEASNRHDVVVIGAGPAGQAAARARYVSGRLRQITLERIPASGVHLVHGEARLQAGHTVLARTEIAGTGQAIIHNEATIEDVIRMAYNTPAYTYGYKLAAADALARLRPDMLRAMRLPSRAHRI